MCHAGRRDDARVRTFLLPPTIDADDPRDQLVFAVRTDPPPDPAVQQQGLLRWWRIDELNMPFDRWRAALHRIARRGHVRVHTFRVPPTVPDRDDDPNQLVYALWVDPADPRQTPAASPPPAPRPRRRRPPTPGGLGLGGPPGRPPTAPRRIPAPGAGRRDAARPSGATPGDEPDRLPGRPLSPRRLDRSPPVPPQRRGRR